MLITRFAYYLSSIPTLLAGLENWWLLPLLMLRIGRGPAILRLRRSRLRFHVRTPMDIWVIKEVCLDRDYEGDVQLQDGWTIVDVGAGIGDFSISVAQRLPRSRIVALEPFSDSHRMLLENISLNGVSNIQALTYALGAGSGPHRLRAGRAEPGQSSTVRRGGGVVPKDEEVPGRSLAGLFEELAIGRCDLLKMDCEGAEYEILMTADEATLARIARIALEYHDGYTHHGHGELVEFLQAKGYRVRTQPSPAHREIGYLFAVRNP